MRFMVLSLCENLYLINKNFPSIFFREINKNNRVGPFLTSTFIRRSRIENGRNFNEKNKQFLSHDINSQKLLCKKRYLFL